MHGSGGLLRDDRDAAPGRFVDRRRAVFDVLENAVAPADADPAHLASRVDVEFAAVGADGSERAERRECRRIGGLLLMDSDMRHKSLPQLLQEFPVVEKAAEAFRELIAGALPAFVRIRIFRRKNPFYLGRGAGEPVVFRRRVLHIVKVRTGRPAVSSLRRNDGSRGS